jgi:hypothetical protein
MMRVAERETPETQCTRTRPLSPSTRAMNCDAALKYFVIGKASLSCGHKGGKLKFELLNQDLQLLHNRRERFLPPGVRAGELIPIGPPRTGYDTASQLKSHSQRSFSLSIIFAPRNHRFNDATRPATHLDGQLVVDDAAGEGCGCAARGVEDMRHGQLPQRLKVLGVVLPPQHDMIRDQRGPLGIRGPKPHPAPPRPQRRPRPLRNAL